MRTALIVAITLAFAIGANATVATETAAERFDREHRIVVVDSGLNALSPLIRSSQPLRLLAMQVAYLGSRHTCIVPPLFVGRVPIGPSQAA